MVTMAVLAVVGLGALVPQALKSRAERHQRFLDSIRFHALASERPEEPGAAPRAGRPEPARADQLAQSLPSPIPHRRNVFVVLLVSVVVSGVAAVAAPSKLSLVLHLAVDDALLGYVIQLVRWRDARLPGGVPALVPVADLALAPSGAQPALRAG